MKCYWTPWTEYWWPKGKEITEVCIFVSFGFLKIFSFWIFYVNSHTCSLHYKYLYLHFNLPEGLKCKFSPNLWMTLFKNTSQCHRLAWRLPSRIANLREAWNTGHLPESILFKILLICVHIIIIRAYRDRALRGLCLFPDSITWSYLNTRAWFHQ